MTGVPILLSTLVSSALDISHELDLPCDPRQPYEAPRDPRLAPLFDDSAIEATACFAGRDWLEPWDAGKPLKDALKETFTTQHKQSLYWGTYIPQLFFAVKSMSVPSSFVTGLMWSRERSEIMRHDVTNDDLTRNGKITLLKWKAHDMRSFAEQEIHDMKLGMDLETTLIKPRELALTEYAAHSKTSNIEWVQRIRATPHGKYSGSDAQTRDGNMNLFFYLGTDCDGNTPAGKKCMEVSSATPITKPTETDDGLMVVEVDSKATFGKAQVHFSTNGTITWTCKQDISLIKMKKSVEEWRSGKNDEESCEFLIIKVEAKDTSGVQLDVIMTTGRGEDKYKQPASASLKKISHWTEGGRRVFNTKIQHAFPTQVRPKERDLQRHAIANLLGGAGFWYGNIKIRDFGGIFDSKPVSLFSFTPSRTSFPRGFLWDEGFHLRTVLQFDKALAAESLASWMGTMRGNKDSSVCQGGWIPREQAIGEFARARIPNKFIAQFPGIANPPTLLSLVARQLLTKSDFQSGCNKDRQLTVGCYQALYDADELRHILLPYLENWSKWIIDSQEANTAAYFETGIEVGEERPETGLYCWRGRNHEDERLVPMTLGSGLDDYPRSYWPSRHEAHLDLASWVAAAQTALADLFSLEVDESGTADEKVEDVYGNQYRTKAYATIKAIGIYHYDAVTGYYADRGLVSRRDVTPGTIADGFNIGSTVGLRKDIAIRCRNAEGPIDSQIPVDVYQMISQAAKWAEDPTIKVGMRVQITKTLKFKRSGQVIWQGTRALVRSVPTAGGKGTIEVLSDTSVTFNVRLEDVFPLLSNEKVSDYCPDSHPDFMFVLADDSGKNLLIKNKIVSPEVPEPGFTEHVGYVSFMPLFLKLLPYKGNEEHVDSLIAKLQDIEMFTDQGLRSLSLKSPLYMTENAPGDAPYWRGAVWININYLAVECLRYYAEQGSAPAAKLKNELARRVYSAVIRTYQETGYLWEHYDDITGKGQRTHPFNGWSALVANILDDGKASVTTAVGEFTGFGDDTDLLESMKDTLDLADIEGFNPENLLDEEIGATE
eukprot:TRINITY_DN718_c6_g3_i1.p1 TRINITY_DN718_c6_g3~~TRINITY_DN718_c6_g3_i1.p1  ORF type:complete len:1071 (+),score=233.34 TRINITY_DN718_c6_g3_i1:51-3215(+)